MVVAVVDIRVMGVGVFHPRMLVAMRVGLSDGIVRRVRVLVMFVVDVQMLVLHRLVNMGVFMPFAYVQPNANQHEQAGGAEGPV